MTKKLPLPLDRELLIRQLKHCAKVIRQTSGAQLAKCQDQIAEALGYNNWSLLVKHVQAMPDELFDNLQNQANSHPLLKEFVEPYEAPEELDMEAAEEQMREWVHSRFTRLVEFAFLDSESESGYAWPSEELVIALMEEFEGQYPVELIQRVAWELEVDGPWGIEDYGDSETYAEPEELAD